MLLNGMKNQFENATPEEISKKEIGADAIGNPPQFVSWFENFKNSIATWPEEFFTDNTLRRAVIIASIPFAVFKAGQLEVGAMELDSEPLGKPVASKNIESKDIPQIVNSNELNFLENDNDREIVAQKINYELEVFKELSKSFNDATGSTIFDFSGRMKEKIDESNKLFDELSGTKDEQQRNEERDRGVKKILENGRLNFFELIKAVPEVLVAEEVALVVHELGHETEALKQGAISTSVTINLLSGYTEYFGKIKNEAELSAAGINADRAYGEFLADSLRGEESPNQFMAIMALAAKSNGMYYALANNMSGSRRNMGENDLVTYAKETNISAADLAIGLTADFLLNSDNWQLLKVALGQSGIKIPESTIALTYELGAQGPIAGVKFKSLF